MKLRCLVVALALLAAFASDSWGQSKRNAPPREETKSAQQSVTDQRGSEQSPAFLKIVATPKAAEETEADHNERAEKESADVWLSAALAVIGFLQLLVFGWQGIQLKQTVSATKEATNLARQEFTATHRPRIIVYGVEVQLAGDTEVQRQVHFRYINAGDTDAFVTSIHSRLLWHSKDMMPATTELHRHDVIKEPVLVPSGNNGFAITPEGIDFVKLVRSGRGGHDTAYCVGVVVYRDAYKIERRTGFCRRYDGERERWLKVEDEDYEYAY